MSKKSSLREFQVRLATRLVDASHQGTPSLLGIQAGSEFWLLNLSDSGEVIPLPTLTEVPLTKPWFVGLANIRGNLYSVVDFSAFQGKEATPQNSSSRLLLIGSRYGNNTALLVTRMLGLRKLDNLTPATVNANEPLWTSQTYTDNEGRRWKILDVGKLLADEEFMDIGI